MKASSCFERGIKSDRLLGRLLVGFFLVTITGYPEELSYFLPEETVYDPSVPSPASFLGYEVGERHVRHHELVAYMEALAGASDRVLLEEYARSFGEKPLQILTITSPQNHRNVETIRANHLLLSDPEAPKRIKLKEQPVVVNLSYGVHGDEASGSNAAILVAYYLAAGVGEKVNLLLRDCVVLLDPALNPDGLDRFAQWVNRHVGRRPNADPNHREHSESWPRGRTNYYLFDLNRDWLPAQNPESRGRLEQFHRWKPNILADFHEMGTEFTYFFQPGVPERNNPLTPSAVFELTSRLAHFHTRALDRIGSLYFTKEVYDDFFVGKGSTYPDLQGAIGILFEQASSRGQLQRSDNGILSFAHTIRNHVVTSLSTLEGSRDMRLDLLLHQRDFFNESLQLGKESEVKAYLFSAPDDSARAFHFLEILHAHQIRVYRLRKGLKVGEFEFSPDDTFIVPTAQPQYRYLTSLFELRTEFEENVFYDISAWTLPLAFNLRFAEIGSEYRKQLLGEPVVIPGFPSRQFSDEETSLAYLIDWRGYYAPRSLQRLLDAGALVKVAQKPFEMDIGDQRRRFGYGTLLVARSIQAESIDAIVEVLQVCSKDDGVNVVSVETSLSPSGIDLGSRQFAIVKNPRVLLISGEYTSQYEVGQVWHLLDRRFSIPVTLLDGHRLQSLDLSEYTSIVLVSGKHKLLGQDSIAALKAWIDQGGTLICIGNAVRWVIENEIADGKVKGEVGEEYRESEMATAILGEKENVEPRPYAEAQRDLAFEIVRGAILKAELDITHPLCYGYQSNVLPVFRDNRISLEPSTNAYATPVRYSGDPLLGGYVSQDNLDRLAGSAGVVVDQRGKGRIILMVDNPNFRGYWYGTNRLFLNSIFFGPLIREPKP